jgi:hypothetical protein
MADNSDIAQMSNEELMREWTAFGEKVAEDRVRLQAFSDEHQTRLEQERVQDLLGPMTEEQKQAAILAIQTAPTAIESEEAVGEVGNHEGEQVND